MMAVGLLVLLLAAAVDEDKTPIASILSSLCRLRMLKMEKKEGGNFSQAVSKLCYTEALDVRAVLACHSGELEFAV